MNNNIKNILSGGSISELFDPENIFENKLKGKNEGSYTKDIVIKFGVDPTKPDIHLGHAVVLRFLRKMQNLGCKVVFLVGDFTARIGDPTGKSKVRPDIDQQEIEQNMKTYLDQVGKILDLDEKVFSWIRNSDWFIGISDILSDPNATVDLPPPIEGAVSANSFIGKAVIYENSRMQRTHLKKDGVVGITFSTFLWTLKHITHSRIIARDMFQERIKKGEEIFLPELLYPVLQGIDSFVLAQIYGSCDLEIGGTDQTFNMLLGRDVMKANTLEPQSVASLKILRGLDGKEKMSKSLNNYIAINEVPSEIFGKVMSIPDDLIQEYFELCTDLSQEEINQFMSEIKNGGNPKDIKVVLAKEIVKIYHGESAALSAAAAFDSTFSRGEFPENAEILNCSKETKLMDIFVDKKVVPSKTEFRRLIEAGAVSDYPDKKINDPNELVGEETRKIKIGKKTFVILKPE